mgnify:FL=1
MRVRLNRRHVQVGRHSLTYLLPSAYTRDPWVAIFTDVSVWGPIVSEIYFRERRCQIAHVENHVP